MILSISKKTISYATLFLNEHQKLKKLVLKVVYHFPNLASKLKNCQASEVDRKGRGIWKTIFLDVSKVIIRQRLIQDLLSKFLNVIYRVEHNLKKILNVRSTDIEQIVNLNSVEDSNLRAMTPQVHMIYCKLKKSFSTQHKAVM